MERARRQSIDVTREETVLWFSREFLKFADWDEANQEANEYLFGVYHEPFRSEKERYAAELPDFERKKVIEMLDDGIETLEQVLAGEIVRRPVNKVDWQNIAVADDVLLSNGKPIFLYDYFSKSVGRPLTDTEVYNDHLGAIFHGGENLYPVDHDRAINSFLLKEDGTFDDELLSEITSIPDTNVGFLLFWNGGIPEWVEKREPEVRKGRGLFTGFDIDNPLVRDVWGKIARKSGELTRGKKVTQLGYILSNEPHWYFAEEHWTQRFKEMNSISSYTDANFKAWLENNYGGDIERLNKNWDTSFADFASVTYPFPISRSYTGKPMWYDWCRYNMQRSTDWFTYIQNELRKGNPEADTSIKLQPNLFSENPRDHGIDMEALTELTSMIGDDAKTKWIRNLNARQPEPWEAHYAYFWEELSLAYDFLESVAPEKIHFNSENHFLSASWVRELDQPADYVRNVYWLATIQGMDANLAWWWARDPDGSPEDRMEGELNFFDPALAGSYAASANQQPHIVNAVTQVMYDLNSFSEEVMAIRKQRRPLRLFYSETSAINKRRHMTEQFELYEQLFFEGFPLGFATQKIIQKQDASNWDAIIVFKTEFVTDAEFDALQGYLDIGGTVVVDGISLARNEYGQPRENALKAGEGTLITLPAANSLQAIKAAALAQLPDGCLPVQLREDNGTSHKGCTWRVVKKLTGDGYLVNILNLGKHPAKLELNWPCGDAVAAVNMLTGQAMGQTFELAPNGVLLLEVKSAGKPLPHSDPDNVGGWIYNTEVSDEFDDDTIDEDRWYIVGKFKDGKPSYKHPDRPNHKVWKGRPPAQFSGRNYRLEDGMLKMETRWEPDFPFDEEIFKPVFGEAVPYENVTTACFRGRRSFLYGYIEIKCKAADAEISSGFWSMGEGLEFDFFEQFGDGRQKKHLDSMLWWSIRDWKVLKGKPAYTERKDIGFRFADDFHIYGIEWDETGIKYYVDGELFTSMTAAEATKWIHENVETDPKYKNIKLPKNYDGYVATVPINLWLTNEAFPWNGFPDSKEDLEMNSPEGEKDDGVVDFQIEYVRVWQKPSQMVGSAGE